jgi:prepilin peptidase CpaA
LFSVGFLIPLTLLLAAAAITDVWRRRIPNALSGASGLLGLIAQAATHGWMAAGSGMAAGVATVAILWRAWLKGQIGGGDVKLAGAAAIWMGLPLLPQFAVVTAVSGGLVAAVCYVWSSRAVRKDIQGNLMLATVTMSMPDVPIKGAAGRVSVPYGAAAAAGAMAILWTGGRWWYLP